MREWTDCMHPTSNRPWVSVPDASNLHWSIRRLMLMAKAPRELNHVADIVSRFDRERVPVPNGYREIEDRELCQEGDLRLWFGAWVQVDLTLRYGSRGPNGATHPMVIRPVGVEGSVPIQGALFE
jgi:hypothetical protein